MKPCHAQQSIREIVTRNSALSIAFEEMGIDWEHAGDQTIEEACRQQAIDPELLLIRLIRRANASRMAVRGGLGFPNQVAHAGTLGRTLSRSRLEDTAKWGASSPGIVFIGSGGVAVLSSNGGIDSEAVLDWDPAPHTCRDRTYVYRHRRSARRCHYLDVSAN